MIQLQCAITPISIEYGDQVCVLIFPSIAELFSSIKATSFFAVCQLYICLTLHNNKMKRCISSLTRNSTHGQDGHPIIVCWPNIVQQFMFSDFCNLFWTMHSLRLSSLSVCVYSCISTVVCRIPKKFVWIYINCAPTATNQRYQN